MEVVGTGVAASATSRSCYRATAARIGAVTLMMRCILLLVLLLGWQVTDAVAQTAAPAPEAAAETPPQIRELLDLLADPTVRDWLERQRPAAPVTAAPATAAATTPANGPAAKTGMAGYMAKRLVAIRTHIAELSAALPALPVEFERLWIILSLEFEERGLFQILLLIVGFVAMGFGVEWLYGFAAAGVERRIVSSPLVTVRQRLRAVVARLLYGAGLVGSFAIGSVGSFLAFDWPPLLREIVLGYLIAFLALRLSLVAGRFLLAPGGDRFRIIPVDTPAAWFWYRRIGLFVGWLAFGWVTVNLLVTIGFSEPARHLLAYFLGLGLLAIGIEIAWRRPTAAAAPAEPHRIGRTATAILLTAYFILLWLVWVMSAMPTFWLMVYVVGLPAAMRLMRRAINHLLRPVGASETDLKTPDLLVVALERGARAALIIGATLLLARAWDVDLVALTASDTLSTKLVRGALNAVVILLVAELIWQMARSLIDRRLAKVHIASAAGTEDARRQARLRTLLPILRNVLLVVLLVMSVLMVLSTMGVEIAPLIAGAGVVGVAIGFGAQTLVKDIISGVFYLLDDAFRIGEYIQSGSYKGTVESFSLRSVKLRHHRGPLFTVPFGELGAVQNMSRDWVIDKLTIGITYDSDLAKARKIIKDIGKQLAENPEFAPHILEPLKMQGVEQFGDFAIQIRMKMMTRPGEQFVIRRKAYAMIKDAFDASGIRFAFPTVKVAGGGDSAIEAAAARQSLAGGAPAA